MKKISKLVLCLLIILCLQINIKALENVNDGIVVSYDNSTKILKAYGFNKYGNLGTGDTNDVMQADEVNLNDKIGTDVKIIDYLFTDINTFLVTEDGRLYASGYFIGDGKDDPNNFYKEFRELKLYSSHKITEIKLIDNFYTSISKLKDDTVNNAIRVKFYTQDSKKVYELNSTLNMLKTDNSPAGYWSSLYTMIDWPLESKYAPYLVYHNNISSQKKYMAVINRYGNRLKSHYLNKTNRSLLKKSFSNNIMKTKVYKTEKITIITKWEDGKVVDKYKAYYKNSRSINSTYSRYITKTKDYDYIDGLMSKVTIKKRVNKKLRISSTNDYYRNSKGQLKSNKYGKALKIVKNFKNNSVYLKRAYFYDVKGNIARISKLV